MGQEIRYISPSPGSTDVTQESTIAVRTQGMIDPAEFSTGTTFTVVGSKSGLHPGAVVVSDDGRTIVFKPGTVFTPGEQVSVSFQSSAQTSDGKTIGGLEFSFTVSQLSRLDAAAIINSNGTRDIPVIDRAAATVVPHTQLNKSASDTLPMGYPTPIVVSENSPSSRDIFIGTFRLSSSSGSVQVGPSDEQFLTILGGDGKPVFYRRVGGVCTDFKLQPNGYLTYYDGQAAAFYELDSSYAVIDSFKCGNGYQTDNHELLILPNGHALLLGLDPRIINMNQIVPGGNPGALVTGVVMQELDKSRNVVFQWRSFDYIPVTDATHEDLTASRIDYIHSNAIDVDTDGNLLLSSRHTDEITKINRETGAIIWRWGGKNNQFTFVNDPIGFSHQHSIRRTPTGTLIMFDDGNFHSPQFSRAVEYTMDEQAKTVTQVWEFKHDPSMYAFAMGSVQRLPNGNTLIGWGMGLDAAVTEARPDGGVALELKLPDSVVSYRAQSFVWQPNQVVTDIVTSGLVPSTFTLSQNYPNPFNPGTVIQFSLPHQSYVRLKVYDLIGREVASLVEDVEPAGLHAVKFDASRLASGVYVYRITADNLAIAKTMVLLK